MHTARRMTHTIAMCDVLKRKSSPCVAPRRPHRARQRVRRDIRERPVAQLLVRRVVLVPEHVHATTKQALAHGLALKLGGNARERRTERA
jgi:hypothetical protein